MGISKEKSFPRGGLPSKTTPSGTLDKAAKKNERDLFSTKPAQVSNKNKRKGKTNKKKAGNESANLLDIKSLDPLTYDKLSEGLKVLGRISEVRDLSLKLSLPGRLVALVPITEISKVYTEALKKITENPDSVRLVIIA